MKKRKPIRIERREWTEEPSFPPSAVTIASDGTVNVVCHDINTCEKIAVKLAKRMHQRVMTDMMFR